MNTGPHSQITVATHHRRRTFAALFLALVLVTRFGPACAESSNLKAGGERAVVAAHLDFKIVIPKVIKLDTSTGALFTNAPRTEAIVMTESDSAGRRSIAGPASAGAVRAAIDALTRDAGSKPTSYTVAMP